MSPDAQSQSDGKGGGGGGGGLDNLFALAHIAAMSEEERAASRSPQQQAAAAAAAEGAKKSGESAPSAALPGAPAQVAASAPPAASRRPAKKRAVPSDSFGAPSADAPEGPSPESTPAAAPTPAAAATAASKRPKQSRGRQSKSRTPSSSGTFKMKANQPSFPVILMAILSAPQNREFITFLSGGASFIVIHPGALARNVLPMHFEESVPSFDQFLHLLAIWGFETIKDPRYPQVSVYRHPDFRNGDWEACLQMKLPDPTEVAKKAGTPPSQDGRAPDANEEGDEARAPEPRVEGDSPSSTARSVTPPLEAALLERVSANQGASNDSPPFSNSGPKFTDMKDGLVYQRLLQQEQCHSFLGAGSAHVMNGYPTMKDAAAVRMNHRRATLDMPPSMMSSNMSALQSMGHRRATLDMPPPSASALMGSNGMPPAMEPGRMGGRPSLPFAAAGFHPGSSHPPAPARPQHQVVQRPRQVPPRNMLATQRASVSGATPSDAEVRSATEDIVSRALEALRPKLGSCRRHTIDHPPTGSTARLDAMTDLFLERSLARLGKRPGPGVGDVSCLMGGSSAPHGQGSNHGMLPSMHSCTSSSSMLSMNGMQHRTPSFMGPELLDRPVRRHSIVEIDAKAASIAAALSQGGGHHHPYRRVTMMGMAPPNMGPMGFGGGRAA